MIWHKSIIYLIEFIRIELCGKMGNMIWYIPIELCGK